MNIDLDPDDPRIAILARASRSIVVTPLDAAHVVKAARTRRHRIRRRTAIGSALAITALAAGITVATAGSNRDVTNAIDAADITQGADREPFPAPPEGMKWVGQNDLVVAVPTDWPVIDSPCRTGAAGEVVNGTAAAGRRCLAPSPTDGEAFVIIAALGSGPELRTVRDCRARSCSGAEVFADQGISIQAYTSGAGAFDRLNEILDSAMVLPVGWTTVPFAPFPTPTMGGRISALEDAGFVVEALGDGPGLADLVLSPAPGSPIEEGGTITLVPVEDPDLVEVPDPTSALDALELTLTLDEPRANGSVPSLIHVQNLTGESVTDPNCVLLSSYTHGFVPPDRPDSRLVNPVSQGTASYCSGGLDIAPGYNVYLPGPTFRTDDLAPGLYLAAVDLDGPPSKRLTARIEVGEDSGPGEAALQSSTDLEGSWTVSALIGADGQSLISDGYDDRLKLSFADGRLAGADGCNTIFGTYVQTGPRGRDLRFSREDLGSTLVGCAPPPPPLLTRLLDVRHVSGSDGVRRLHAANWMIIAELTPGPTAE